MAQGSLQQKGGAVGFEGIGADIKPLLKQFEQLRKKVKDGDVQKRIHRAVGKLYKEEMLKNIKDAKQEIRVRRGGKKGGPTIPIGTLRRSIKVWQIDKQHSTFWVGPRVGKRQPEDSDGWFANIVEGGDQKFGGNTQKGVFERSIRAVQAEAFTVMRKKYDFQIRKIARKKNK